jgi:hypothetical protein
MTRLRSCYFCGTTGALSEYATLPGDLRADDEEPPRVVLCDRCHTKLTEVLAPIVERLQEPDAASTTVPSASSPSSPPDRDEPSGSADQPAVTFSTATDREADDGDAEGRSPSTAPSGTSADDAGASSTPSAEAESNEDTHDAATAEGTAAADDEGATGDDSTSEPASPSTEGEATAADDEDADTPAAPAHSERVYHQLLRFLRNREFPIPRTEAEAVAQSAYDLSASEATEVIQLAVDRDVLAERDGELHRR